MPKVSVYLPDEMYDEVRRRRLSLSALTQEAVRHALVGEANREWCERVRALPSGPDFDISELMAQVRDDFDR